MKGQLRWALVFFINSRRTELQNVKDAPGAEETRRAVEEAAPLTLSRLGRALFGEFPEEVAFGAAAVKVPISLGILAMEVLKYFSMLRPILVT